MDSSQLTMAFGYSSVVVLLFILVKFIKENSGSEAETAKATAYLAAGPKDTYPPVEPLPDFEWSTTEPKKQRPFKPIYHLTMALTNSDASSLIEMDQNYLERIKFRREIMSAHPDIALGAYDRVKPAVDEFYIWLLSTYLPSRYPRMFTLCRHEPDEKNVIDTSKDTSCDTKSPFPNQLFSHVTKEHYPLKPAETAVEVLKGIGGLIDDDCQFLLPSEDGDGYSLAGFVCCCPSGFKMSDKLGLKLRNIHKPVPHYKEKLEKSMDRSFEKLEVGRFMRRSNWVVATTPDLFNPKGNHLHEGDEIPTDEQVDISRCILRSELQTVHRLPQTKGIIFSFKTYTYPLSEVKAEGSGEELATAIDGIREGSAPDMYTYKKAVVWGDKVKAYLRS